MYWTRLLLVSSLIWTYCSCSKDRTITYSPYKLPGTIATNGKKLIHYWDFSNSLTAQSDSMLAGSWTFSGPSGAGVFDGVSDTTVLNARNNNNAGLALRLRNPASNFILNVPTTGYKNAVLSFAVKRTSAGAQRNVLSYSIDGKNFVTDGIEPNICNVDTVWNVFSFDFSSIASVNDNPLFKVKIEFAVGNNGSSGNDRYDNISIDADSIPVPPLPPVDTTLKLIQYWNFNSPDISKTLSLSATLVPGADILFDFAGGSYDTVVSTATKNARNGDLPGFALRVRNPVNSMIIKAPTTGFKDIVVNYQVDKTAKGAQYNSFSYSLNGGVSFDSTGLTNTYYAPGLDPIYVGKTFDLTSIPGANDNPNLQFKVMFSNGNTGSSGNNRFDNITVEGRTK